MSSHWAAAVLRRTYLHRVSAVRPLATGQTMEICQNERCALSRSAITASPAPPDHASVLPESTYRLSLYTSPELSFALGDQLEITDETGRLYRADASDSFHYPSHNLTVVEIKEILPQA